MKNLFNRKTKWQKEAEKATPKYVITPKFKTGDRVYYIFNCSEKWKVSSRPIKLTVCEFSKYEMPGGTVLSAYWLINKKLYGEYNLFLTEPNAKIACSFRDNVYLQSGTTIQMRFK